jgi:hypothetical protein
MANRLKVTELDFDQIKNNLKNFLKQQSEFTDYDFEGAGLNVLLDVLAYNTHYNAYYLNMIANESFMHTAMLRNSVVSHAKKMGYTPRSVSAARANINFTVVTTSSTPESLILPRGYKFISNAIDGVPYAFITLEDTVKSKTGNNFVFNNLEVYEGQLVTYGFTHSELSNPKQNFNLPDANIDTSTLTVVVRESSSNTQSTIYSLATDILGVTSTSEVYYLQEGQNQTYDIYFGDNILGKKIPDGAVVTVNYLKTSGQNSNKASGFVATQSLNSYTNFNIIVNSAASGGKQRETVDEIKFAAPLQFTSQNRAVTKNDYIKLIQQKYPYFDAVNIWGGEENDPPVYGKVFISAKPSNGFELTTVEKEYVIDNILKPISILTVRPEIIDVDYNFVKVYSTVYYDPTKTLLNLNILENTVKTKIQNFCVSNLNKFNSLFKSSALRTSIDSSDNSILSNELELFLSKRFSPTLIQSNDYNLDFGIELSRGTTDDNFYSSPNFTMIDENGSNRSCFFEEVPSSFTGVESITILNPGINYSSTPIIEIVGDGSGATATAVIVNSKLQSIKVNTPGIGYTTAIVRISGGGGILGEAKAILENRYGQIRISYFKPDEVTNQSTKIILNASNNNGVVGSIDYLLGKVTLTDFSPLSIDNSLSELTINVRPKSSVFYSQKNKMLAFDAEDPTSTVVTLKAIK